MVNIAIIAEYNPMHNGHIYQINKIKENYPESNIIVISSTNFVQRGDLSIIDKFTKANISIENGVDLFLELPTIASLQSADYFAKYAIKILDKLDFVDYLAFGVDASSIENFYSLAEFQLENFDEIFNLQKSYIDKGLSYKKAYIEACKSIAKTSQISQEILDEISNPNNTLAFQYMQNLSNIKSKIIALPILRNDGGYNSQDIDNHDLQSATTLRKLIAEDKSIFEFVPNNIYEYIESRNTYIDIDSLSEIFTYLSSISKKSPDNICGYEEGMLNLLNKNLTTSIKASIDLSANKRYSKSRLRRFVCNYILDIKNSDLNLIDGLNYIRPLAFNDRGKKLLKTLKNNEDLIILQSLADYTSLNKTNKIIIEKDIQSFKLYSLVNKIDSKIDFKNIPYKKT